MRPPKCFRIERRVQLFQSAVVGSSFNIAPNNGNKPIVDRSKNQILRRDKQQPLPRFHQNFRRLNVLLRVPVELTDQLFKPLRRAGLRFHHLARALNRLGDARFIERLQHVIDRVYIKGLHGVVIERRRKNHVGYFHLALDQLAQDTEAIKPGHLHVKKNEVRRVLFDQVDGIDAVLPLADDVDFRERFQQERELVARRLFVVDNDRVDGHAPVP